MERYSDLPVGTKVYYTGDIANHPNTGTIQASYSNRWNPRQYDIAFDDGSVHLGILPSNFGRAHSKGGHRFEVLAEREF